jgi:hypothetical protein
MSAFTTVVGRLGELSESELRQLYLIVGVRLGKTDGGASASRSGKSTSNKGGKGKAAAAKSSGGAKKASSKGNPSRKSQWETHPLYREYKRLKKVVETQAKERNLSFAAVDTPERAAYNTALSQWLEAKSSFRDHSGPEKETAEASSAKGKEKATAPAPPAGQPAGGSSSGLTGGQSWADEVHDAMDVESESGSGEDSDRDNDPATGPSQPVADGPKRGTRTASLPSRGTPPKKSSGVPQKK